MPERVNHGKWMRRGLKRLLVQLPPARRYFARKDKIAADLERFLAELSIRTAERDEAMEQVEQARAELRIRTAQHDETLEKVKQVAAERDASLQMIHHLRLTAAAFLVQRDAAREMVRQGDDRTEE